MLFLLPSLQGLAAEPDPLLLPGLPIARKMAPETIHRYRVDIPPGVFVQFLAEQDGVDVTLHLEGPDGVWSRDGYYEPGSVDRLSHVIETGGNYRLEVRSGEDAGAGVVGLRMEMRPSSPADHALVRAEDLSFQALKAFASNRPAVAVPLWDQALPLWQRATDPWGEAEALYWSAKALERLKKPEAAGERYARAAKLYGEAPPGTFPIAGKQRARSLANAGVIYKDLGRLDVAEEVLRRAVAAWSEIPRDGEMDVSLNNLGRVLRSRGNSLAAVESFERSLGLCRTRADALGEARVLGDLAIAKKDLGRLHEALEDLADALRIYDARSPDHPGRATILNNLGATLTQVGEFELAASHYRQALAIHRDRAQLTERTTELVATTLNNLGWVYRELAELDTARQYLEEALDLATVHGLDDLRIDLLDNLALLDLREDRPQSAVQRLEDALAALPDSGDQRIRTILLQDLGRALLEAGHPETARRPLEASRALALEIGDRAAESRTLFRLARIESSLGDHEAAERLAMEALDRVESLRTTLPHPFLRMSLTAMRRKIYETVVDLLMTAHAEHPRAGWDVRAFATAERARGRGLVELLREARVDPYRGVDPEWVQELENLRDRLRAAETRRLERREDHAAEQDIERLVLEVHRVEGRIRRANPSYDELTYPDPIRLAEAQRLLDADTVFLTYMLGEERSYLWVVTPRELASFVLPARREIEPLVRAFVEQVRWGDPAPAEASKLSETLLVPARRSLNRSRWAIVPDGALHHLPFAALPRPGSLDPVVALHEIVHVPSLTALAELRKRPPPGWFEHRVAVVADPVFDATDPRLSTRSPEETATDRSALADLGRLPSTAHEAQSIADLVEPEEARLLLGFEATREAVMTGALHGAEIAHFATHAFVGSERTDLVRLELSRFDAQGREIEGSLHYRDLYDLDLQARLVVLSACETATGRELRGEGLVGLSHGLLAAGAHRIVASLWRIDDASTASLMQTFYQQLLRERASPSAALHRAQKQAWLGSDARSTGAWAAFILQGDWRS